MRRGVAAAARSLNVSATIVIPYDAPALKIANTRAYGANVVLYDRYVVVILTGGNIELETLLALQSD